MTEKIGNMPKRSVYTITVKGEAELRDTLKKALVQFDYDTNVFTIAAFFIDIFDADVKKELLEKRLELLQAYLAGINRQVTAEWEQSVSASHVANLKRMIDLVNAEISGTKRLLASCERGSDHEK